MASSIENVVEQIDRVARSSGYKCRPVSWEDAQRGHVGGVLSSLGANISDVRLWEKGGKLLYTLRSDNWNERLGFVRPEDVSVVVGNHVPGGAPPTPTTLRDYLASIETFAKYANVAPDANLLSPKADAFFTIRFQCVFLPIAGNDHLEFCTEVYNYNTWSDQRPRNMLLLATPQGTAVQQDGAGAKKLFFHAVDPSGAVHRYWLEAERSTHGVGGAQHETAEEAAEAAARGKATAIHIGTRAMGTRFNVQMLVQVPLLQPPVPRPQRSVLHTTAKCKKKCKSTCANSSPPMDDNYSGDDSDDEAPSDAVSQEDSPRKRFRTGTSNAARVSRGSEVSERWFGVATPKAKRDGSQHGTITVSLYYTVADGVPSEEDVRAAIADLNQLYASCDEEHRLADSGVPKPLTGNTVLGIAQKVTLQPYALPTWGSSGSVFPESGAASSGPPKAGKHAASGAKNRTSKAAKPAAKKATSKTIGTKKAVAKKASSKPPAKTTAAKKPAAAKTAAKKKPPLKTTAAKKTAKKTPPAAAKTTKAKTARK